MRNFKNTFVILLLLSLFSCNTQSISEDEVPLNIQSSISLGEALGPIEEEPDIPTSIKVSVQYFNAQDRGAFRAMFETTLGITAWAECSTDPTVEIWIVTDRTQEEFTALVEAIGDFVVYPPGSAGSLGASDPYAGTQQWTIITPPVFYFENICQ